MKLQTINGAHHLSWISLLLVSFIFIASEVVQVQRSIEVMPFSANQALALLSFTFSAYFCFSNRVKIKHIDLIFTLFVMQFLFILFFCLFQLEAYISTI